jgi:RHS repeat-associated protein
VSNSRVRRVGSDGLITTFAGTGIPGFNGDGGLAINATVHSPWGLALGPDGSLYIADLIVVRRVAPDGIISTVAGGINAGGFGGDGGPPTAASLNFPTGLALGPDWALYIVDAGNERVRKVAAPLPPGFQLSDILIASEDGSEVYVFNGAGLHQRTLNALSAATRYTFAYDDNGHLATVTDGDGNVTIIEHDASGNPTAIVAPFGQRTTVTVDAKGYLANITDPAGGKFQMGYTPDGLLTQFTDPNNNTARMQYDALGRLKLETDAAGGFQSLSRAGATQSYTVSLTTALNRTTAYQVQDLTTANQQRVTTFPDGIKTQLTIGTDGSRNTTGADGTVVDLIQGPDPRFFMQAPLAKSLGISTGGVTSTLTTTRTATLADPPNLLSLTAQTDTITINGRVFTSAFDATSRTFTKTSAAGRQSTTLIDPQGRVTKLQASGLLAASVGYDTRGRLASVSQGTGSEARTATFSYNSDGYVQTVTDPLGRSVSLQYDPAGRISQNTLPDGRGIINGYDASGNLISLTPPGRPVHVFRYTPVDLTSLYAPPSVAGAGNTVYTYNADRQLALVTRPDNKTVSFAYDNGGRMSNVTIARGVYIYTHDTTTGHLSSTTAPDGGTLAYSYGGALLTNTTWSGTVTGAVSRTYDNDFRVTSISVNGTLVNFRYDADSLLTQAGSLAITRDSQNGLLTGITLGNESETFSYNGFGELTGINAAYNATSLLTEQYTLDKLGRVAQKVETIGGITTTFDYYYDSAGRLFQVEQNGTTTAIYAYDDNDNRKSVNRSGTITFSGPYDNQDRMSQYGNTAYRYTANGELQSKTAGTQKTTYQCDELGNLLSVTLPDGALIEYVIDGQNRRIGKKVGGNLVKGFLYQDQLNPIAELDSGNNVVSRFVYGSRSNVPDYMVKNGITYRIVTDQLGSPRVVVDVVMGTIAQRLDYDEFGQVMQDTNPGFQPFGFAGGLYDPDTKLVRFGARDYDAETGRWIMKDPLWFDGGDTNLYGYALTDPINRIDPSGQGPWGKILDAWAALAKLWAELHGEPKFPPKPPPQDLPLYFRSRPASGPHVAETMLLAGQGKLEIGLLGCLAAFVRH